MMRDINIKVGKTYHIKHIIEELRQYPDIKIGHIYALNKHEYRLGVAELEELQRKTSRAERENAIVYDIYGKKKINPSDVMILDIIDPYTKYIKYEKFYEEFYRQIDSAIDTSSSGVVMALSGDILEEARKRGLGIEKDSDLFGGISIYFNRKGIESRRVSKEKEGKRNEYMVFGRSGTITKEEKVEKKVGAEKGKLIGTTERDVQVIKEKTKEFEPFYSDLEKTVTDYIRQSKEANAAVKIDNIIEEAKKTISNVESKKDILLVGLIQFFNERGISTESRKADNYLIFRMI